MFCEYYNKVSNMSLIFRLILLPLTFIFLTINLIFIVLRIVTFGVLFEAGYFNEFKLGLCAVFGCKLYNIDDNYIGCLSEKYPEDVSDSMSFNQLKRASRGGLGSQGGFSGITQEARTKAVFDSISGGAPRSTYEIRYPRDFNLTPEEERVAEYPEENFYGFSGRLW